MGSSCSGTVHKRRVSIDSLFPIATVDLSHPSEGDLPLETGGSMSEEEVSKALEELQTLARQFPQDKRVQLYMGIGLFVKGYREAAINPLRIGIQGHDPYVVKGYYLLGLIYMSRSNLAVARTFLEKGLSLKEDDVPLLLKLSELYVCEKAFSDGLAMARKALDLQKDSCEAKGLVGQCLLGLGDVDGALIALKEAVIGPPKSFKASFALGNAYRRKGLQKEAVYCYRESIMLSQDSRFFLHYFSLATLYLEMDLVVEAIEHFRRGQEYGPDAEKLMREKGFDLIFTPSELPSCLESLYSDKREISELSLKRISEDYSNPIAAYYLALSHIRRDNLSTAKALFLKSTLLLQTLSPKPLHSFLHTKINEHMKRLDAPMEENLALGEIDEEHARGQIKELNTHSTPLSQSQSPDQSFSLPKERGKERLVARSIPVEGFKVRAESLESSHTPKRLGGGLRTSTSASLRTSPRNAPIRQATPKGNSTLSLNTTIDRLGLGRPVFSGSLDVSLLEAKSPAPSDTRVWQSPKSTIYFADLISGSGVSDALEEAERLRQQNIIIKSHEKRLLWSERRDLKQKRQLDESMEASRAIAERRNFSNQSRVDVERTAKREKEEEAEWRREKIRDEQRVREAKLQEQKARERDDLDRSVMATQTSNIRWVREKRSKELSEKKRKDAEARRDRLETIRILREQRAEAAKLDNSSLLHEYHMSVSAKLKQIISETQTSAQSLLSTSQKM